MHVPLVDLSVIHSALEEQITSAIGRVIQESSFAGGPEVERFEQRFAETCGTRECVAVSSGTAAIELTLRAAGIGAGDEVIVPVNTFVADAEAVLWTGAMPVLVDCVAETGLVNLDAVQAAVTPATAAIIPVHLYGQPVAMDQLQAIAAREGLLLLEDACQAHGAMLGDQPVGGLGDAAAFSFYPSKNLGAMGDGGAVTTNDAALAARLRMIRDHGCRVRYQHEVLGGTNRLDGIQAAVLDVKLPHLPKWNADRLRWAGRYRERLAGSSEFLCLENAADDGHVHHLFVVRTPRRDERLEQLHAAGIGAAVHYPVPLHRLPSLSGLGHSEGEFPVAEKLASEILSLPLFPGLTESQFEHVMQQLETGVRP